MEIGVEHYDSKRQKEDGVLILERAILHIPSVIFPIALCKSAHNPVNLLCFSRELETAIGQEVAKSASSWVGGTG